MSSLPIEKVYAYLGAPANRGLDGEIFRCLEEIAGLAHFRYLYKFFSEPPEFLLKEPYLSYLEGSTGVILAVMTLGGEVDKKIKLLQRTDVSKAVIYDAAASAYLEFLSDEYEKSLDENLSYRFCPGYGGSDVTDLKHVFDILKPEKIGVTLSEAFYILPAKSMAGIIAVGGSAEKSCKGCVISKNCKYLKGGIRCYD